MIPRQYLILSTHQHLIPNTLSTLLIGEPSPSFRSL